VSERESHRVIYISHAHADASVAHLVAEALTRSGLQVASLGDDVPSGSQLSDVLDATVAASDIVVALISPAYVESAWGSHEIAKALEAASRNRAIAIVAAVIAASDVPESLKGYPTVDLREPGGIPALAARLRGVDAINLHRLTPSELESLVVDILSFAGFEVVARNVHLAGREWDLVAESQRPFMRPGRWGVDIKHYRGDTRLGLAVVQALYGAVVSAPLDDLLIVTTGQVTSVVRSYVETVNAANEKQIHVLEGSDLTSQLAGAPSDLVAKYFPLLK
jgi:hypothetical protein